MQNQLFIYLLKRNNCGIKILFSTPCNSVYYATTIDDIDKLGLSKSASDLIKYEYLNNRIEYKLMAESAASYNELKKSLIKRGCRNISHHQFILAADQSGGFNKKAISNDANCMVRKNSEKY